MIMSDACAVRHSMKRNECDMTLKELFWHCLNAKYIKVGEDGDYAVERHGDTLLLLFQWSRGKRDWQNNLDFPAKPYCRMDDLWFCHRGFLRVWKSMRDSVERLVARTLDAAPEIRKISCVGFSHGAALSVFATEDMAYLYGERLTVNGYGFGCPRVLWGLVPMAVKKRFEHFLVIRNVPDIVTHLPPSALGFRHVGSILEIGVGEGYAPIAAHYPEAYRKSLGQVRVQI